MTGGMDAVRRWDGSGAGGEHDRIEGSESIAVHGRCGAALDGFDEGLREHLDPSGLDPRRGAE